MTQSTANTVGTRPGRFVPGYIILVIGITLIGIGISITRPYLSLFGTDIIHMSPAALGLFMCMNALGSVIASTWLGKMSDTRTPKKDIMLFSAFCSVLGYASFLLLHHYVSLLIASTVLLGFGSAVFPQMFAYARESLTASKSGDSTFSLSTLRSFFSLAWVIGPIIGEWALGESHFNRLFMLTAAIFVVVCLLVMFRLHRRPAPNVRPTQAVAVLTNLKRREVLTACLSFIAVYTTTNMNSMCMPLLLTESLHAPQHVVGWIFSLCAGLEIPIMLGLGAIAYRVGKRVLLLAGSISGTFYFIGVGFAHATWEILSLQLLMATFISISVSIGMSYMQDFMPDALGSATTLYGNTSNIGAMLGSLLGGMIAQAFSFRTVFWCCAALAFISYILLLRIVAHPEQSLAKSETAERVHNTDNSASQTKEV